jgi:hypothetical protein
MESAPHDNTLDETGITTGHGPICPVLFSCLAGSGTAAEIGSMSTVAGKGTAGELKELHK